MANWSTYTITKKQNFSNYIRISLDGQINYIGDNRAYSIDFKKTLPYTDWDAGDKIDIDTDKTRQHGSLKDFDFWDNVAYLHTTRWENKYWEAVRAKNNSESNSSTRYSNLETERNEWRRKFNDKNSDYEDYKEKYEEIQAELSRLKNERIRETQANTTDKLRQEQEKSTLRVDKAKVEEKLESAKARELGLTKLLEDTKTELGLVRVEKDNQLAIFENKLDQKQQLLENVRQALRDLEIKHEREKGEKNAEVKEKDGELRAKEEELKRKEEEVKKTQRKMGQTREELLSERSRLKEEKLKAFAAPLGVSLQQINNLRRYYERLTEARKNYNQANIETHEDNIARIEEELSQNKVSIDNIQKVCRQCEKLAKMRVELNEIRQQQFQAQQEVPTNNL